MFVAQAANPGGLWDDILNFLTDFDRMFPGFREVVLQAQLPFFLVAFAMIVYHTIKRLSSSGSSSGSNLRAIGSAVVFTLAVALCNKLVDQVDQIFIAVSTELGSSSQTPQVIEQKKEELIYALERDVERQNSGASGGGESRGFIYYLRNPGEAINQGVDSIVPDFGGLVVEFVSFFLVLYMKIASLIVWGFWLVQQFLYAFSLIFLPAMIAAISINALSSIGTRYVMSVIGLLSWPLGWALINVGTEAMLTAVVETVKTNSTGWDLTTYLWAIAICSIIPLWIILGYAFIPFVIQRMVTTGANAAAGIIGQVGGTALTAGAGFAAGSAFSGAGNSGQGSSTSAGSPSPLPASSGKGTNGGNPQTSAANSVSGGGFASGQSMASAPDSDSSDSFQTPSESFGETPPSGGGGDSSGQGMGAGDSVRAAAGGAMMAGASGFNTLAQDSGNASAARSSQGGGSTSYGDRGGGGDSRMGDRIARSQSSQDPSLDSAFGNLAPSSAAARRTIESRRG